MTLFELVFGRVPQRRRSGSPQRSVLPAPGEAAAGAASFSRLLEAIDELAANRQVGNGLEVNVEDIAAVIGPRAYGPLLVVIGLFSISPATIAPGMTWFAAALTLVLSLQMTFGARHPWLPAALLRAHVSRSAIHATCEALRPWARRVDAIVKPRLVLFAEPPFMNLAGLFCVAAALATFPLGLIPVAPVLPGFAIVLVGIGLLVKDGLLLLVGGALVAAALGLAYAALS
mgnify:CR=1 FL=1